MIICSATGQISFFTSKTPLHHSSSALMDGGNSWPATEHSRAPQNTTIMNRIMLRFRPIAPKPVPAGSSPGSTVETNKPELVSQRRVKRKYVRVKKNNTSKCKPSRSKMDKEKEEITVLPLQLMPESSSRSLENVLGSGSFSKTIDFWKSEDSEVLTVGSVDLRDRTVEIEKRRVVESWVMVENMTNTFVYGEGLGCSDMEKMMSLEGDTCPGIISDGFGMVTWVNQAYRRLVDPLEGSGTMAPEMVTWLVLKEEKMSFATALSAFACTVRVVYTWRNARYTQTMPCDVWRMDCGGFAWRLDANAALSLGRN